MSTHWHWNFVRGSYPFGSMGEIKILIPLKTLVGKPPVGIEFKILHIQNRAATDNEYKSWLV